MEPYYEADGITIYHADCREVLPDLTADVVVTDPPYGVGLPYDSYVDTPDQLDELVSDVAPLILAAAPVVAMTPGIANVHRWPAPLWMLCWFDPGGAGSGPWGFTTWQPVLVYGRDPYLSAGKGRRPDGKAFMLGSRPNKEDQDGSGEHPCPKPLDVMKWILSRVTTGPASVLDPFMGSGATLRAAKDHGHRAIGIELSERYCEIAAKRLAQGVLDFGATP